MNHGISVLFRVIPLVMAFVCFFWGYFIFMYGNDLTRELVGPVVFFLGSFCLTLYAVAAAIIRQLIHQFRPVYRYLIPGFAYLIAFATIASGIYIFMIGENLNFFIAGHLVVGIGLIAACVSTVAAASTRFYLISVNSDSTDISVNPAGFSLVTERVLIGLTIIFALVAWIWSIVLLSAAHLGIFYFAAGALMGGLACICTGFVALVATMSRQIRCDYNEHDRRKWPNVVMFMGIVCMVWGIIIIFAMPGTSVYTVGFIMLGLGLVCFCIFSKVLLLAKAWRRRYSLANRVFVIPVVAVSGCLFMGAFLFEMSLFHVAFLVSARVLMGLGAVSLCLFSLACTLESGTSKK